MLLCILRLPAKRCAEVLKGNDHVCEVQICHKYLLQARNGLPGHVVYSRVRNAKELLESLELDRLLLSNGRDGPGVK